MTPRRIGILTGGGDCPGLNAVIRAVAKPAMNDYGAEVIGIEDGFEGFVQGRMRPLRNEDVSGILAVGGTILGTSNKGDPFHFPVAGPDGTVEIRDMSGQVVANYHRWKLDAVVAVGGDGTMHIALKLGRLGLNIVGVPKTIDNDLWATDLTFGHLSAVQVATEAIDRLHTTASSHHRVMILEVMGRYAGWIALRAGIAGGADIILIPEIPFRWEPVFEQVHRRSRRGKRFSIVCVSEGVEIPGHGRVIRCMDPRRTDPRQLGGVGDFIARRITEDTGQETRVTVLGHLQRGGSPTAVDRVLATRFGAMACRLVAAGKFGMMAALKGDDVVAVPLEEAVARQKLVPPDHDLVRVARSVGTCMGDE